ncbi:putative toxin-antitoxin system toxin component, PIN family [Methylophilus sp.]|jgi:putative PIN family toxin of toxin-antitoxin system|uniref:putative toxin-antitoxin system toxin component, PIN family n=1 Tax=Methylophilus sp. TaxID=29541 RepID=UPI0011D5C748|nr:putative toxin-antitoxin system toxin component, PIN family [Methylophilus sp.]TXI45926.1 MAG: putative toxin-antitoxin system toxin component, PIN family [Methylophilus sp.]
MIDIIIDTNVLVAAMKSRNGNSFKLLSMIDGSHWRMNISTPLVFEYESILKREIEAERAQDCESLIDYICLVGTAHQIFYLWRPMLKDPKDDHILELAVKSNASIITWNVRDFGLASQFGIKVFTPAELLQKGF